MVIIPNKTETGPAAVKSFFEINQKVSGNIDPLF